MAAPACPATEENVGDLLDDAEYWGFALPSSAEKGLESEPLKLGVPGSSPCEPPFSAVSVSGHGCSLEFGSDELATKYAESSPLQVDPGAHSMSTWLAMPADWHERLREADRSRQAAATAEAAASADADPTAGVVTFDVPILRLNFGGGASPEYISGLFLRFVDGDAWFVARYERSGTRCEAEQKLEAVNPSAWGLGTWYHVGAAFGVNASGQPMCRVCGSGQCSIDGNWSTAAESGTGPNEATLVLGSESAPSELEERAFVGRLDSIAVHNDALDRPRFDELARWSSSTAESEGFRWSTWNSDRTSSTWSTDCSASRRGATGQGIKVEVKNPECSTGGVLAHINPPQPNEGTLQGTVKSYREAALALEVVGTNSNYDFILSGDYGSNTCMWHRLGGGRLEDRIDLTQPSWCRCDMCDCDFFVHGASIGTRWDQDKTEATISVCSLDLTARTDQEPASGRPQRALSGKGVNSGDLKLEGSREEYSWCWRPVSFNHDARTTIVDAASTSSVIVGELYGEENTAARLVADFSASPSRDLLNLKDCSGIEVEVTVTVDREVDAGSDGKTIPLEFVLVSPDGATKEWEVKFDSSSNPNTYCFALKEPEKDPEPGPTPSSECTNGNALGWLPPFNHYTAGAIVGFDIQKVLYLGWQKPYATRVAKERPLRITVHRVNIVDADGNSCGTLERTRGEIPPVVVD